MLKLTKTRMVKNILAMGIKQYHLTYKVGIFETKDFTGILKSSVTKNVKGFFDGGKKSQYVVFKVADKEAEPVDAITTIAKLMKQWFLGDDPANRFTAGEVATGYSDKEEKKMFYIVRIDWED